MSKVLLVTGGSRGIGAAVALLAAKQGYAVAVNFNGNQAAADSVAGQIRDSGGTAMCVQADVSVEAAVLAMFARIDVEFLEKLEASDRDGSAIDLPFDATARE